MVNDINVDEYILDAWRNVENLDELTGDVQENSNVIGSVGVWVLILIMFLVGVLLVILFMVKKFKRSFK